MFSNNQSFDANQLQISVDFPEEPERLLEAITDTYKRTASAVNTKEGAFYQFKQQANFQQWPDVSPSNATVNGNGTYALTNVNRTLSVLRTVVDFGALPAAAGIKAVPHNIPNITKNFIFTNIYGAASNKNGTWIPIPQVFSGGANDAVGIFIDLTNVNLQVSSANYATFTQCFIVLEYIPIT